MVFISTHVGDDAIDAIMNSFSLCSELVNIKSEIVLGCAKAQAELMHDTAEPLDVASSNSNSEKALAVLNWYPSISLQERMRGGHSNGSGFTLIISFLKMFTRVSIRRP